jgi:lipoprotein-anchoring transpeptidase ErfK/SrfK
MAVSEASAAQESRIRSFRPGKKTAIAAGIILALLLAAVGGFIYTTNQYGERYEGKLLPGTSIGGIDVSGMTRVQAVKAVRASLGNQLDRKITISYEDESWKTTPQELGAYSNAGRVVDRAFDETRDRSFFDMAKMRFLGEKADFHSSVALAYPRNEVRRMVEGIAVDLEREPVDATLDYSTGWVKITDSKTGLEVQTDATSQNLFQAMRGNGGGNIDLSTTTLQPAVTSDDYDQVLLVRQGERKLYLYQDGKITDSYTIAVGEPKFPTPTGIFEVVEKRYMPTWVNPAPKGWGSSMPATIGPGIKNPLGLRAINWSASGIRFHGTEDLGSLGTAASHGCVRLSNDDVVNLYQKVQVGSPIVSTTAG